MRQRRPSASTGRTPSCGRPTRRSSSRVPTRSSSMQSCSTTCRCSLREARRADASEEAASPSSCTTRSCTARCAAGKSRMSSWTTKPSFAAWP
eukprot:7592630-Alexandrium_andersonii.AAC.1